MAQKGQGSITRNSAEGIARDWNKIGSQIVDAWLNLVARIGLGSLSVGQDQRKQKAFINALVNEKARLDGEKMTQGVYPASVLKSLRDKVSKWKRAGEFIIVVACTTDKSWDSFLPTEAQITKAVELFTAVMTSKQRAVGSTPYSVITEMAGVCKNANGTWNKNKVALFREWIQIERAGVDKEKTLEDCKGIPIHSMEKRIQLTRVNGTGYASAWLHVNGKGKANEIDNALFVELRTKHNLVKEAKATTTTGPAQPLGYDMNARAEAEAKALREAKAEAEAEARQLADVCSKQKMITHTSKLMNLMAEEVKTKGATDKQLKTLREALTALDKEVKLLEAKARVS